VVFQQNPKQEIAQIVTLLRRWYSTARKLAAAGHNQPPAYDRYKVTTSLVLKNERLRSQ
jgi:hypothetical protein